MTETTFKNNILVVDDTPANLRLLVNLLTENNYKVRAVPSGKLALAGIKQSMPDLILLDIMMPEMNGYEVCEKLKADPETRHIPVIFISAINEVLDKVKAFDVGGVDYVTKPFQVEEVLARVETQLENRSLQKSLQDKNQELGRALAELQAAQNQLILSEKMAALGQLVASIAHEINTPLGAIRASSNNSAKALGEFLEIMPELFRELEGDRLKHFLALIEKSINNNSLFNTKEKRQFKREITKILEANEIPNARRIADTLVYMKIYGEIEEFLPLLKDENRDRLLAAAYNVSRLHVNGKNITSAVERASKVVFALKSYARYDQSGEKQLVQITEGIETILELYYNQLKQGVEVIREYDKLSPIWCYPDELNQVWTNLIHNAIQAMNGKGKLEISVSQRDSYVEVTVTDSGPGIAPEIREKIFDPFFTTKPPGEGSGLGLDIVRKIINKHEGKINVESRPGKTKFTICLPINSAGAP
ncbi:MAG: response regulator [Okeania sp. SIO2H7]|nr:response regulator [Okeania sp. SIO2H7]